MPLSCDRHRIGGPGPRGAREAERDEEETMAEEKAPERSAGVRELRVAVPDVEFDQIVKLLREVWVVPRVPGIRGCAPCRSGFDRLVLEDPAFQGFGR
jgi:hypothetical protein